MNSVKTSREIVAIGDVHGQLNALVKLLRHAGLVDAQLNWCGGKHCLVQMGDVFDRGPHPREAAALLNKLQEQAPAAGGEVVLLVGNHELELLLSNFILCGLNKEEAKLVRDKLTRQVLHGHLRAAYAHKGWLFTHAGVTRKLLKIFQLQLDDVTAHDLTLLINMVFKEAIHHAFFKHPIFNISVSRFGRDKFGGIFWEDLDDLMAAYPGGSPIKQIVAHTQVEHVVVTDPSNIIPIDVGMHRRLQYLRLTEGIPKVIVVK